MSLKSLETLLLAVALGASACGGDASRDAARANGGAAKVASVRSSQILITIESFAGRRVVPFGGTIAMPELSKLVAAGTVYDDTVSTTTLARPALVSILTGVPPDRSGVRDNVHDALAAGLPTLAEGAKGSGYETAAFVSTPFASYSSGLQRGFELFDGPEALTIGPAQHVPQVTSADKVAAHFKEWLAARDASKPYFAWIHLADLNGMSVPLQLQKIQTGDTPVSEFAGYDAKLASIDVAIGSIRGSVEASAAAARVEWTLVGTHGTQLGEEGRYGDAFWLSDETLRIPLVRVTSAAGGRQDPRPSWLPDVAATLAAAMGAKLAPGSEGISLESAPPPDRARLAWNYALDDQLGWPPMAAVRAGSGFDANGAAAKARPAVPRERRLPEASRKALSAAGLSPGSGRVEKRPAKPEPWLRDLQLVRRYLSGDRPGLAGERSRALIKAEPDALAALVTRAFFFSSEPRKEAPALRDKLLAVYPNRSDALHWSAHLELVEMRYDRARALLEAAIATGPVEPEMHYDLACVRSLGGDAAGALAELDRALAAGYRNWDWIDKDPDLANARSDQGFPALLRTHGR